MALDPCLRLLKRNQCRFRFQILAMPRGYASSACWVEQFCMQRSCKKIANAYLNKPQAAYVGGLGLPFFV